MCHLLLSCGSPSDKISPISLSSLSLLFCHSFFSPLVSLSLSPSLYLWSTRATPTPILPHSVQIPAGPVLQSLNTVNNYLSRPKLAVALPPSPPLPNYVSFSFPFSAFPSSLSLSLIFPLPFPDSGLNRMLILTGGFQSRGSSFSSWCAPQVHQHKVTLLFKKKGSCFFLPVYIFFFSFTSLFFSLPLFFFSVSSV